MIFPLPYGNGAAGRAGQAGCSFANVGGYIGRRNLRFHLGLQLVP